MEAATSVAHGAARELSGDKARRIVEAMRISVAARGIAGSTFDHVAREAGVSRGLLHYYFGTKERLLVEVVRRECDVRIERLEDSIAGASSADDVIAALVRASRTSSARRRPRRGHVLRDDDARPAQRRDRRRAGRARPADPLRTWPRRCEAKRDAGVVELRADPDVVATFLFALADGVTIRRLSEPEFDIGAIVELSVAAGRSLLS